MDNYWIVNGQLLDSEWVTTGLSMGKYCLRDRMCSHIFALIEGKGLSRMYGLGKK